MKKSEIIIEKSGTKKIYLFLKLIPQNNATDKIGVKFGGWGASLENAAKNVSNINSKEFNLYNLNTDIIYTKQLLTRYQWIKFI